MTGGLMWLPTLESESDSRMGHGVILVLSTLESAESLGHPALAYLRMTTFMLHGVSVRVKGNACAPMLTVVGSAQTSFSDWS